MYQIHAPQTLLAPLLVAAIGLLFAPSLAAAPADDQYAVAAGFYAQQRWRDAADEFAIYLKQFPNHERADVSRFFHAEALVQLGRLEEAKAGFTEFLKRHPLHKLARQALFRAGETAWLSGATNEALSNLEAFRKQFPQDELNAYALGYLGESYLATALEASKTLEADVALRTTAESTRYKDALGAFQECLRRYPDGPLADECRFGAARANEQQRDFAGAERYYKALTVNKQSPLADNAQLQLGLMAYHRGQYTAAIEALQAFEDGFPESELRVYARYWLGMSHSAREDWKRAAETLTQLASDAPAHELAPAIEFAAGDALRKGGQPLEAIDHYDRVLDKWPRGDWADDCLQAKIQTLLEAGGEQRLDNLAAEFDRRFPESSLRPAVRLALGRWHLARGDYAAAIAPLEEYLQAQGESDDAPKCRSQLIAALAGAKLFDAAAKALDEFARRNPQDALVLPATLQLADAAQLAREQSLAARLYERLTQDGNPPDFVAKGLAGLARTQSKNENGAKSVETLDRLLKDHPESAQAAEASLQRAKELEKLGHKNEAIAAYQLLLEKHSTAKQTPQAMLGAARLLDEKNEDQAAAELLERLLKDHADVPFVDAALYQYAWVLVDLQRDAEADGVFARLHKAHRGGRYWADATFRLAERAAQTKDNARAGKLADELLRSKCEPDIHAHALFLQGQIAVTEQRWKDVPDPLTRLLEEHPQSETALAAEYWIAESHFRLSELERADGEFKRLATKAEGRNEPWLAMIPLRQAQIFGHRKEWNEAFELAQTIATRYPNFRQQYEVDYLLGRCLGNRAQFDDARAAYERVIRSPEGGRTETAAMAQWMIGESYFHQKQYDEAIRAYHRVERLFAFPRWQAAALLQAGKCREAQGAWQQAVELYAQLLKDYPQTTFSDEATNRLRVAQDRAASPAPKRE